MRRALYGLMLMGGLVVGLPGCIDMSSPVLGTYVATGCGEGNEGTIVVFGDNGVFLRNTKGKTAENGAAIAGPNVWFMGKKFTLTDNVLVDQEEKSTCRMSRKSDARELK